MVKCNFQSISSDFNSFIAQILLQELCFEKMLNYLGKSDIMVLHNHDASHSKILANLTWLYSERAYIIESLFRRENISLLIDILDKYVKNSTELRNTFNEYSYELSSPNSENSLFEENTTNEPKSTMVKKSRDLTATNTTTMKSAPEIRIEIVDYCLQLYTTALQQTYGILK